MILLYRGFLFGVVIGYQDINRVQGLPSGVAVWMGGRSNFLPCKPPAEILGDVNALEVT